MSSTSSPEDLARKERRNIVRWLLRPLAEPAFLRLYLRRDAPLPREIAEDTFHGLPADAEHPEESRAGAWKLLEKWLPKAPASPIVWYTRILQGLSSDATLTDAVQELSRFWALPELFPPAPSKGTEAPREPLEGYHEIHCHVRGAVPYLALWRALLDDERLRANLRKMICKVGTCEWTWAELLEEADALRRDKLEFSHEEEPARIRQLVGKLNAASVQYLAICATLRRSLLYQRGRAGLSDFADAYDRYAKLQKGRGRAESNQMRALVREILREFQRHGACSVELRPTLDSKPVDLRRKLGDILLGYFDHVHDCKTQRRKPLLLGLVPSLYKQEALPQQDLDDPDTWQTQAEVWLHQVEVLLDALDDSPALRFFVVGLDAAGKERGCPPRALAPAFAEVQRRTRKNALARVRPGRTIDPDVIASLVDTSKDREDAAAEAMEHLDAAHVEPLRLGLTVHAGEDFEDPLTGLRHIWESVEVLDLRPGDRVGHAIAAALDPDSLSQLLERRAKPRTAKHEPAWGEVEKLDEGRFRIRKPRGTHLLDLAWAAERLTGTHGHALHAQLAHAATAAFGHPTDPRRLARTLVERTHAIRPFLPGVRFDGPAQIHPEDWTWLVVDDAFREAFKALRRKVLDLLIQREIVVESCPTSNLVVANLDAPPLRALMREKPLRCALATDDPGLLGAFPREEMERYAPAPGDKAALLKENRAASFIRLA